MTDRKVNFKGLKRIYLAAFYQDDADFLKGVLDEQPDYFKPKLKPVSMGTT